MQESIWRVLLVISVLFLAGSVGYFAWKNSGTIRAMVPGIGGGTPATASQEETAEGPEKQKSLADLPNYGRFKSQTQKQSPRPRRVVQQADNLAQAPRKPFPVAEKLPIGMEATKLRAEFRDPAIRITGVERGQVVETYVYKPEDRKATTIARLRDGKLEVAETTVQ